MSSSNEKRLTLGSWGWNPKWLKNSTASLTKNSLKAELDVGNLDRGVPILRKLIREDAKKRRRAKALYLNSDTFSKVKKDDCLVTTQPLSFSTNADGGTVRIKTKAYLDFPSAFKAATKGKQLSEKFQKVNETIKGDEAIVPPGAFIKRGEVNGVTHFDFKPDSTYMKANTLHKPSEFAKQVNDACKLDRSFINRKTETWHRTPDVLIKFLIDGSVSNTSAMRKLIQRDTRYRVKKNRLYSCGGDLEPLLNTKSVTTAKPLQFFMNMSDAKRHTDAFDEYFVVSLETNAFLDVKRETEKEKKLGFMSNLFLEVFLGRGQMQRRWALQESSKWPQAIVPPGEFIKRRVAMHKSGGYKVIYVDFVPDLKYLNK